MEMRIKCVNDEGKMCGMVHIHKVTGSGLKKIGEIKYSDESDRKWIVNAMTERHPHVSVIE